MSGHDYSAYRGLYRPHDLVWVAVDALDEAAPAWAKAAVAGDAPVVVRRAPRADGLLPIGVRGRSRGERYAAMVNSSRVLRCVVPESLTRRRGSRVPAIRAIGAAAELLDAIGADWGITGAVGFELATDTPVCNSASDLDLLLRQPESLARDRAWQLHRLLAELPVRCDVQLETPHGAVALADWAGRADRVLIKSDTGPFLSRDPWSNDLGCEVCLHTDTAPAPL